MAYILTKFPRLLKEKQLYNSTDPPPFLMVGIRHFSVERSFFLHRTPLDDLFPKSLILVSSDQSLVPVDAPVTSCVMCMVLK